MRRIIKFIKWLFNIPTYYIGCDPATKDGDYTYIVKGKFYPRTGIYEITDIENPHPQE